MLQSIKTRQPVIVIMIFSSKFKIVENSVKIKSGRPVVLLVSHFLDMSPRIDVIGFRLCVWNCLEFEQIVRENIKVWTDRKKYGVLEIGGIRGEC